MYIEEPFLNESHAESAQKTSTDREQQRSTDEESDDEGEDSDGEEEAGTGGAGTRSTGAGGDGGGSELIGTRVSGVVRLRANTATAALDLLCEHLTSALSDAQGPPEVEESERTREHCWYDVTWVRSAAARSKSTDYTHAYAQRRSASSTGSPSMGARVHVSDASAGSANPLYGHVRPFAVNPHAALLLDVQTRLLRPNGTSFAYFSGRSQRQHQREWQDERLEPGTQPSRRPAHDRTTSRRGEVSDGEEFDESDDGGHFTKVERRSAPSLDTQLPWFQIGRDTALLAADRASPLGGAPLGRGESCSGGIHGNVTSGSRSCCSGLATSGDATASESLRGTRRGGSKGGSMGCSIPSQSYSTGSIESWADPVKLGILPARDEASCVCAAVTRGCSGTDGSTRSHGAPRSYGSPRGVGLAARGGYSARLAAAGGGIHRRKASADVQGGAASCNGRLITQSPPHHLGGAGGGAASGSASNGEQCEGPSSRARSEPRRRPMTAGRDRPDARLDPGAAKQPTRDYCYGWS